MAPAATNPKLKAHLIMLTAYSNRHGHGKEKECAVLHMERAGVPQDMVKAYTWFRKAASYDHEDALRYLSSLPPPPSRSFQRPHKPHAGERPRAPLRDSVHARLELDYFRLRHAASDASAKSERGSVAGSGICDEKYSVVVPSA